MSNEPIFTLAEARTLLPWLHEVSSEAETKIIELQGRTQDHGQFRAESAAIIQHWAETVAKLGALPKQPFTVDFNSGSDYYCWEFPESDIFYRHDYHRGYAGRHRIEDET